MSEGQTEPRKQGLPPLETLPRILIVDHFDSYTLNILSLLASLAAEPDRISERVVVLPHTHHLLSSQQLFCQHLLPHFDAVILSPGPGTPHRASDFGFGLDFLKAAPDYLLPTLGICLGHQGLAAAFGGLVKRAASIQHGTQSSLVYPGNAALGSGIFANVRSGTKVTRYNSLVVDEATLPDCLDVVAFSVDEPNHVSAPPPSELIRSRAASPAKVTSSERCILGLAHKTLPLWGVQFHPESIESQEGSRMLFNFLQLCENRAGRVSHKPASPLSSSASTAIPNSLQEEGRRCVAMAGPSSSLRTSDVQNRTAWYVVEHSFETHRHTTGRDAEEVFEKLFRPQGHARGAMWLDSAREQDPQSVYSYMAQPAFSIAHRHRKFGRCVEVHTPSDSQWIEEPLPSDTTFWQYLDALQQELQTSTTLSATAEGKSFSRWKTGFVGYWSYEMRADSLGLEPSETLLSCDAEEDAPSAAFGFCDAVLQLDHARDKWTASILVQSPAKSTAVTNEALNSLEQRLAKRGQSIGLTLSQAQRWIATVSSVLAIPKASVTTQHGLEMPSLPMLRPLDHSLDYAAKVEAARALISHGESYELCLTTQFVGRLPEASHEFGPDAADHFALYKALRHKNPAPYAAYIQLPRRCPTKSDRGWAILSTSPERFLSMTAAGAVEMKPIKGTVARAGFSPGDSTSTARKSAARDEDWLVEEDARRRALLEADPKERAENLMIVDLIRADLLSFCKPHTVRVPKLMQVESYQSLHQLVTTVEGQAQPQVGPVEALRRCFPPGSMTGAPKRRSVNLLERLEGKSRCAYDSTDETRKDEWQVRHRPRGPYSGALGWLGVDGAASFSVVIRTVVADGDEISIGAGGAITYLSDAVKEWEEVLHKVRALADVETE